VHPRKLIDDFYGVFKLLLGVLTSGKSALRGACPADIRFGYDIPPAGEIAIKRIIVHVERVILAIGQKFKEDRKFLIFFLRNWLEVRRRKAGSVVHRQPVLVNLEFIGRRGRAELGKVEEVPGRHNQHRSKSGQDELIGSWKGLAGGFLF
jgi:hypothetical protein